MKTITTISLLLTVWLSASAESMPSLQERIAGADVIAIISVTNVTRTVSTNAAGSQVTAFIAEVSVERTLKGNLPKAIRVKDETAGTVFSADDLYRPTNAPLKSYTWAVGTRRFLVFLKASGNLYSPLDSYCLAGVYGTESASARVSWIWGCPSLDEATASIEKILRK